MVDQTRGQCNLMAEEICTFMITRCTEGSTDFVTHKI